MLANSGQLYVTSEAALAKASSLASMGDFLRFNGERLTYNCDVGNYPPERLQNIPIREIEPPLRRAECELFPRSASILSALRNGAALPPVEVERLPVPEGSHNYRLRDGFHRYYLCRALGISALPSIVWPYFNFDEN